MFKMCQVTFSFLLVLSARGVECARPGPVSSVGGHVGLVLLRLHVVLVGAPVVAAAAVALVHGLHAAVGRNYRRILVRGNVGNGGEVVK